LTGNKTITGAVAFVVDFRYVATFRSCGNSKAIVVENQAKSHH